ncbi:MAG: T9SS type A sorting domain-containing protein [Bacteroidales bacterium]
MGKSLQTLDGLISFTLGEVVISNFTIDSEIITQGFHQTNLTVTEVEDIVDNGSKVKIFPNPTNSNLYISLGDSDLSNFKVQIYQYDGVLISILDSDQCLINLDFSDYLNGTYILKILKDNIIIGTYKVVKQKP